MSAVAKSETRCGHCGEEFDPTDAPTVPLSSAVLYRCPACERWTED